MKYLTLTANGAIRICNLKDYICLRNVTSKSPIDWHSFFPVIFLLSCSWFSDGGPGRTVFLPPNVRRFLGQLPVIAGKFPWRGVRNFPYSPPGHAAQSKHHSLSVWRIYEVWDKTTNHSQDNRNSFDEKVKTWPSWTFFNREPTGILYREDLRYGIEDLVTQMALTLTSSRLMCTFCDARHVHRRHGWRPGTRIRI